MGVATSVRRAFEDRDAEIIKQALAFADHNDADFSEFCLANGLPHVGRFQISHVRASLIRADRIEIVGDYAE